MNRKAISITLLIALAMCACSSDNDNEQKVQDQNTEPKIWPIKISTTVSDIIDTRATDFAFETGDEIGLYVVNHNSDGTPGTLMPQGNHVNNMRFTYVNGSWTPDTPLYWQDNNTYADFYLYYPYRATVSSIGAMPFSVNADQSTEAAYKAGDLLIGSTYDVASTDQAVSITAKHVMSQMLITVVAGNGFTDGSLDKANVAVKINGVKTQSTVNLATATVTATGTTTTVTPLKADGSYKALIVPQSVAQGNLITVTVDGRAYNLQKSFTFIGGKRHRFTVTLSKTNNGINVNIDQWEDDGTDNGGTAE